MRGSYFSVTLSINLCNMLSGRSFIFWGDSFFKMSSWNKRDFLMSWSWSCSMKSSSEDGRCLLVGLGGLDVFGVG